MQNQNQTQGVRAYVNRAGGVLRIGALAIGLILFAAMFSYASTTVYSLFSVRLGAPDLEANLAVLASVGIVFGTLLIALASEKHSVRGLAGLCLFVWLLLTLSLVALEAAARGGILAVPESLASIGQVIAALLAALALVPAITIPLVARQPDEYTSSAAAVSHYIGFVAKGVGIAASIFASAFFGLSRGMPVEVAVLCGFLLESCFMWSYFSLTKARQARDAFDMFMWAVAVVLYGAFIALVSIETISTLARIEVPLLRPFANAGATLFASAVGLAIMLTIIVHVLTSIISVPMGRKAGAEVIDGNSRTLSRRMADRILGARRGWGEVRSAWSGDPNQLTEPRQAQAPVLAKEVEVVPARVTNASNSAGNGGESAGNAGTQGTKFLA